MPATAHHHIRHPIIGGVGSPYYHLHHHAATTTHVLPHSHTHHPPRYDAMPPPTHYREEDEYNDDCYDPEMNADADASTYRSVKRRRRLTQEETRILNHVFEETTKPNSQMRKKLAAQLSMTPRAIQIWFQNRRAKMKRDALEAAGGSTSPSASPSSLARKPTSITTTTTTTTATTTNNTNDSSVSDSPSTIVKLESPGVKEHKSDRAAVPPPLDLSSTVLRRKSSTTSNSSRSSSSSPSSSYSGGSPSLSPLSASHDDNELNSAYSATPSSHDSFPSPNYITSSSMSNNYNAMLQAAIEGVSLGDPADLAGFPLEYSLLSHQQYAQDSNQIDIGLLPSDLPLPYHHHHHQAYPAQPSPANGGLSQLGSSFYSPPPPPYALDQQPHTPTTPGFDLTTPDFMHQQYFMYRPEITMLGIGMCADDYGRGGWGGFGKSMMAEGFGFDFLGATKVGGEVMGSL